MERRVVCKWLAATPWLASGARAQRPQARVAWMSVDRASSDSLGFQSFRRGMAELGWHEGRNLAIQPWWGEGSASALRDALPGLAAYKPDVVVAQGGLAAKALIEGGVTYPLVFTFSGDPVLGKVAESYVRPGGNRTGITFFALELVPKRLELMRLALPRLKRVALLSSPLHAGEQRELEAATRAATALGMQHDYFPVRTAAEIDTALERVAASRADAILAFADALVMGYAERIARFSLKARIPAVSGWAVFAEKGNLMTYGPVLADSYYRLATFVDRILKGAKAGDMPIEFPTTVELVLNRKAATAMGVTLPPEVLTRANRVID